MGAEVTGLKVITWDRVYFPSHPEAYTQKILGESAGYEKNDSGIYIPSTPTPKCSDAVNENGIVTPITNQKVIDYIKTESANLKSVIESFELLYDKIEMIDECNIQLSDSSTGTVIIVRPEKFIKNNIMDFCSKQGEFIMATTNQMGTMLNKLERKLGLLQVNLPESLSKETWLQVII